MTMMLTVYCPECFKSGRHRENWPQNSLLASVCDVCTDAGYDLEGRDPTPEEKKQAWEDDEKFIREVEDNEQKCGLCGLVFRIKRTAPSFGCPGDHMPGKTWKDAI